TPPPMNRPGLPQGGEAGNGFTPDNPPPMHLPPGAAAPPAPTSQLAKPVAPSAQPAMSSKPTTAPPAVQPQADPNMVGPMPAPPAAAAPAPAIPDGGPNAAESDKKPHPVQGSSR